MLTHDVKKTKINFRFSQSFVTPTERRFVRVNHKNELYFSIISFQNKANRVYVPDINIVILKLQC